MRAPVLAVGDGALGFWGALREVFPETEEQRCWVHKIANVLDALPKSAHPAEEGAGRDLERRGQGPRPHARSTRSHAAYGAKFPKAVAKITDDLDELLRVLRLPGRALDPPAHHQPHRVDLRHRPARTKVTKGPGSKAAGLAMAFKLIEAAQGRWRAVNAPHLVALVRAGATFDNGKLVERPKTRPRQQTPHHPPRPMTS